MRQPPVRGCAASPGRRRRRAAARCQAISSGMRSPPRPRRGRRPAGPSCRAARRRRLRHRDTGGSPSAAASAPTRTRFTNFDVAGEPRRRNAATSTPARLGGGSLGVHEHEAVSRETFGDVDLVQRATARARRRRPGCVIASWRRIGLSSMRVYARSGAPRRSGPYSGNACTLLPSCRSARRVELRRGLRALPGARVPADLFHAQPSRASRGRRARRASPREPPRRRSRRRSSRRRPRSTSGSSSAPSPGRP